MRTLGCLIGLVVCLPAAAQESPLPPADRTPALRLASDGPRAPVTGLAFAPDGSTLYVGGLDKVVRAYGLQGGQFREGPPVRLPVGPGNAGAVNAVAVSPDGRWLAVGGRSPMRGEARFGDEGLVVGTTHLPPAMRRDLGVVYLIDRTNPNGGKVLRGHRGEVRAAAFAAGTAGPVLVTAATERDDAGKRVGAVRVWEVATGNEVAARTDLPSYATRPGLAAWGAGKGVRIAIAWPDDDKGTGDGLRVWDVAGDKVWTFSGGTHHGAVAATPGKDEAVVSGAVYPRAGGQLVLRTETGDRTGRAITLEKKNGADVRPLAVGRTGAGYVVLVDAAPRPDSPRPAELRALDPDGTTRARVDLPGLSPTSLPAMAISPDGRFAAVGGFADHRVEVFDVAAVAAGKGGRQVLPGAGGGFASVAFLTGDKLWAGGPGQTPAAGGLVFDFAGRKAEPNDGKVAVDAPAHDATFAPNPGGGPPGVTVRVGGRAVALNLRPGERSTAAAYLPAGPAWKKALGPVAAVAHTDPENAVTLITLFDAATGRRLRQLVGPEQPVRWLAFSAARPLLAAVGDGRTVSVWSLKDLDRETGTIEGLVVADADKAVTVATVAADAPEAVRGLKPGDVIEAVGGEQGKGEAVASAVAFRLAVRTKPVGTKVAVLVRGRPVPVVVPVGRGVEQRNPLFSVWVGPAGAADWVGWSPVGPYDAGALAAEARIGWLSATGDPAAPVSFAGADQYRKAYHRKDVLRFLVEKAELSVALDAQADAYPPPAPRLRIQLAGEVPRPAGPPLVRDAKTALQVDLSDVPDEFPLDRAELRWRATVPGGEPGAWQAVPLAGREVSIDLAGHPWARGRHSFEVALHRTPASPPAAEARAEVAYVPAAPTVTALVGGKPVDGTDLTTEDGAVRIAAKVGSAAGGAVDVRLDWTDPAGAVGSARLTGPGKGEFAPAEVKLSAGRTKFVLTATTRGAGEFGALESQAVEFGVTFTPPKVIPPPRIGRLVVAPEAEAGTVGGRAILVTDRPAVRVTAGIESDEPLTAVEWDGGDGEWRPRPFTPADRGKATTVLELALPVGQPRTVRVRAKAGRSEYGMEVVELAYHPPLPKVRVAPLTAGAATTAREIDVEGTATAPIDGIDFRMAVAVASADGKSRSVDATVNPAVGAWKARITLEPGANRLGLVVRNKWREEARENLAVVTFRRPPRVVEVRPLDAGEGGVADVVATVAAAEGLDPTLVVVNGRPVATDPPKKVAAGGGQVVWQVTAPAVPLRDGDDWPEKVTVAVRNPDGDSPPVVVAVRRKAVEVRPPAVVLADGGRDRATDQPRIAVEFRVTSKARPRRVEVWHADPGSAEFERVAEIDPSAATPGPDGFTLSASREVGLRPGVNRVRVTALSADGEGKSEYAVSFTPPAVRVVVETVEAGDGQPLDRRALPSGDLYGPAAGGTVVVRGRVRFASSAAASAPGLSLALFANHVGHLPVPLDPPGPDGDRAFRAPAFLNAGETRVRVEVRAPGRSAAVPQQAVGGTDFRVLSTAPLVEQRLHLVVVGLEVESKDRAALAQRVITSIGGAVPAGRAGRFDRGEFKHGAFAQAVLYDTLVGEVDEGRVARALGEVARELRRLGGGKGKWVNDLVLLYYQGRDWVGSDGHRLLHTTRSQLFDGPAAARYAIRVDTLPPTPGVRLVLLNVTPARPGEKEPDPLAVADPLLRYPWKDGAAATRLFPTLQKAVTAQQTLGGVVADVGRQVAADPDRADLPYEFVPEDVRGRRFSAEKR